MAAIIARALGRGLYGMPFFVAGFIFDDLTLFIVAAAGLAALAEAHAPIFIVVRWGGAAYLIYLAYGLWTSPISTDLGATDPSRIGITMGTFFINLFSDD